MLKIRRCILVLLIILLIVLILLSFVPQVTSCQLVNLDSDILSQHPATASIVANNLSTQYGQLAIVTVQNWWSSCECYLLPYYSFNPWEDAENCSKAEIKFVTEFSKKYSIIPMFCNWEVRDLVLLIDPAVSDSSSATSPDSPLHAHRGNGEVEFIEHINPAKNQSVWVALAMQQPGEETNASCTWTYTLYCCGNLVGKSQTYTLTYPYPVDCPVE